MISLDGSFSSGSPATPDSCFDFFTSPDQLARARTRTRAQEGSAPEFEGMIGRCRHDDLIASDRVAPPGRPHGIRVTTTCASTTDTVARSRRGRRRVVRENRRVGRGARDPIEEVCGRLYNRGTESTTLSSAHESATYHGRPLSRKRERERVSDFIATLFSLCLTRARAGAFLLALSSMTKTDARVLCPPKRTRVDNPSRVDQIEQGGPALSEPYRESETQDEPVGRRTLFCSP